MITPLDGGITAPAGFRAYQVATAELISVPALKASVGSAVNNAKYVVRIVGHATPFRVALRMALARDVEKPDMEVS